LSGPGTGISLSTATADARRLIDAARAAEDAGFASIWCYDHLSGAMLRGDGVLEAFSLLGAFAVATERATFGSLVLNATIRRPAHIALGAATLQALSGGRFRLGLGAGASPPSPFAAELQMFGLRADPAAARRARLVDTIGFLRALWSGEPSYGAADARAGDPAGPAANGDPVSFFDVRAVPTPAPPCPIVVGANGPKMALLAGQHADAVNLHSWQPDLAELATVARQAAVDRGHLGFSVSVEGPWDAAWLDAGSSVRRELAARGVDDVIVAWHPATGVDAIRQAAALLH
jgi:alkanesulfonate monooxygenase SsuD/methylene tetrahydromethanopterin reductase-like flavin-dependent oxidoreductase (luciferase family)